MKTMTLRLATYNLETLDLDGPHAAPFVERILALRPVLLQLDADVLCLQEVNSQKGKGHPRGFQALDRLLEGTPYASFHRVHSLKPGSDEPADVHNLVTLSRFPITSQRSLWHDYVPPGHWQVRGAPAGTRPLQLEWDRPLLYACLALPTGEALHVLNLHLRAPRAAFLPGGKDAGLWRSSAAWAEGYMLAAQKRQGQALEARLFVEDLFSAEPKAMIAACGDLNADAHEMPTRILQALPEDLETEAYADRALLPLERRVAEADRYTVLHDGRRVLLDHILASPALAGRCRTVEIPNAGLADEARVDAPVAGSLHAPLVATFALPDGSHVRAT
jgi:endonuclease/exonuclease/phosphatase family metal-dependent hydrolase